MNAREVVEELLRRQQAGGDLVLDDLVADGMIVEHWACRDDMGLVDQLRDE